MKKKFLYVIMTLVFAVALGGGSVAVLSASELTNSSIVSAPSEGDDVSVSQSADRWGVTVSNSTYIKQTMSGNFPVYTVSYAGAQLWVDLPAGRYKLRAYGASGGGDTPRTYSTSPTAQNSSANQTNVTTYGGNTSWNTRSSRGGAGGYVDGIINLPSATRLYLYVGGAGRYGGSVPGGYNGGGNSQSGSSGSGGGASDIRIGGTSYNHRVLVAGGGGGADNIHTTNGAIGGPIQQSHGSDDDGSGGAGGGVNGQQGMVQGTYKGSYPTQTGIAGSNTIDSSHTGRSGSFGVGATPTLATDTGGGGGGWYGGSATNHNQGGAGGGSSYVLTSSSSRPSGYAHNTSSPYNMTSTHSVSGIWSGNGKIIIEMQDDVPVTRNKVIANTQRGTASAETALSDLASDSQYNTLKWVDTNKIYSDANCTQAVPSDKLTVSGMSENGTGKMRITPHKYFAQTTFYVKIKDSFPTPLVGYIAFKFGVNDNDITAKTGVSNYNTGSNGYSYKVGPSTTSDVNAVNGSGIYNPGAVGTYTVLVPKPIAYGANDVYINAKDLFNDGDIVAGSRDYDELVITSVAGASTSVYEVLTSASDYKYSKGYTRVRVARKSAAAASNYLNSVTLTVRAVEKSTGTFMGTAKTIQLVFKVDNTRPKLQKDYLFDSYVGAGGTRINLEDFCYDYDRNRNEIKEIKVPTHEFIYLDRNGNYRDYEFTSSYSFSTTVNSKTPDSLTTGEGSKSLSFEPYSVVSSYSDTSRAYASYTIDSGGQYFTLNPLRATRNQFASGETNRVGHFYFMVRVEDKGDPTDNGVWYPIAVRIANTDPSQPTAVAVADSGSDAVTTDADGNKVMYFSPMGIGTLSSNTINVGEAHLPGIAEDRDSFAEFVSGVSDGDNKWTLMHNEFLVFDTNQFVGGKIEKEFYRIELVDLFAPSVVVAKIAGDLSGFTTAGSSNMSWQRYSECAANGISLYNGNPDVVTFKGIKVTFLRSTNGVYIQQPIVVKDTRGGISSSSNFSQMINLVVKVDNSPVTALEAAEQVKNDGKITAARTNTNAYNGVNKAANADVRVRRDGNTVTYSVPNGYSFWLTPYDLATDKDIAAGWEVGKNTNPGRMRDLSASGMEIVAGNAAYATQFAIANADLMYCNTTDLLSLSDTASAVKLNRLVFDGDPQGVNMNAGSAVLDNSSGVEIGERIIVSATSRTSSGNPMTFYVTVADGEGSTARILVNVEVVDNKPELSENASEVFYLSSNFKGLNAVTTNSSDDYKNDETFEGEGDYWKTAYNVREFTAKDLASDYEDNTLSFVTTTPVIYTMNKSGDYVVFSDGWKYVNASFSVASGKRTGQVLRVEALACTQNIEGGLYIGVRITDGYGFVSNDNTSTIIFQVEVVDSKPEVNSDTDTGFTVNDKGEYEWKISPNNKAEVTSEKYIVSNEAVKTYLRSTGTAEKDIRVISADNDNGDGLRLYAGEYENFTGDYPNVPLFAENVGANSVMNDVAVLYSLPLTDYPTRNELVELVYFSGGTTVTGRLNSPYNKDGFGTSAVTTVSGAAAQPYVDNLNWAIKIKTSASFAQPMEFTVRVRDTADRSRAKNNTPTEYSYDGKRVLRDGEFVKGEGVDGATTLNFKVDVGSLGMVVTHNVYNEVDEHGNIDRRYYTTDSTGSVKTHSSFEYKGLEVSSTGGVDVPMSYFAFPVDIPTSLNDPNYVLGVSYNEAFHDNSTSNDEIFKHISLTDGVTVWTGATLNDNPFLLFGTFCEIRDRNDPDAELGIEQSGRSTYLNPNVMSVTGGNAIYRDLYENMHGLKLTARGPRTGKTPLKLTLDLALWRNIYQEGGTEREIATAKGEDGDEGGQKITGKATVDVSITNQLMDVTASVGSETGVNVYDTALAIPQGNISTYTLRMSQETSNDSSLLPISYTDPNMLNNKTGMNADIVSEYEERYRDSANFLYSSLGVYDRTSTSGTDTFTLKERVLSAEQFAHMVGSSGLINNSSVAGTVRNLAKYLGVIDKYDDSTSEDDIKIKLKELLDNASLLESKLAAANPNKYYDDYFTIENGSDGDSFSITVKKKTSVALENVTGYDSNRTLQQNLEVVRAYARDRHLEVEIVANGSGSESYRFYYPLQVIVYDTYGGSEFTDGSWQLITIKLCINNATPTANTSLYSSAGRYMEIDLTKEDNYSMSVMDAVIDRDMVKGATAYLTKAELTSAGYDTDTHDWIVSGNDYAASGFNAAMPVGYVCYNAVRNSEGYYEPGSVRSYADRKIDVKVENNRIVFSALEKDTRNHTYVTIRFTDNHGATVDFNVFVRINNKAPVLLRARDASGNKLPNNAYYANNSTDITMKTGDTFYLAVTPYDLYLAGLSSADQALFDSRLLDKDPAGFSSATATLDAIKTNGFTNDSTKNAQNFNLGVYLVADDDSPETLKFVTFTGSTNDKFTVEPKNVYTSGGMQNRLSYKITAKGVCNKMPLRFTVVDDSNRQVSITFNVTVKSTKPELLKDPPKGLEKETDWQAAEVTSVDIDDGRVFALHIKNGEKYNLPLTALCNDPDIGDNEGMYLYKAFSGSPFSVGGNENGVTSSQYVSLTAHEDSEGKAHSLTIEPVNFFATDSAKKFEQVVFYIMDKGGQSLSDAQKIIINVYVEPSDVTNPGITNAGVVTAKHVVKSKAEYTAAAVGSFEPSRLQVVRASETGAASGLIVDRDYGRSGTSYSVSVYAMLDVTLNDSGEVTSARTMTRDEFTKVNIKDNGTGYTPYELKRYVLRNNNLEVESSQTVTANRPLYNYVANYFDFDFASDGSALDFVPNNMTDRDIPLYVEVSKIGVPDTANYKSCAYVAVSVANSAPTAIEESDFNEGAFTVGGDKFLHFVGRVGESRTYKLQDVVDANKGLFTDLDTNDAVTYVGAGGKNGGYVVLDSYDYGDGNGTVVTNPGYKADAQKGIDVAFGISSPTAGDTLTISIRRKIDVGEVHGKASVKIPIKIYGVDKNGAKAETVIVLEICNSEPTLNEVTDENKPYSLKVDPNDNDNYILDIRVEGQKRQTVMLSDFYYDADRAVNAKFDYINFVGGDGSSDWLTDINQAGKAYHSVYSTGISDRTELFRVSTTSANDRLIFDCVSYNRGATGIAYLQIEDSVEGARTKRIEIRMTVANTAPVAKKTEGNRIDLLGSDVDSGIRQVEFDIHDFFTDANPGDNAYYDTDKSGTYMRIYSLELRDIRQHGAASVRPDGALDTDSVFMAGVSDTNPQKFYIQPIKGSYGWQTLRLYINDDGGRDFVEDVAEATIDIDIYIALDTSQLTGNTLTIARGRTDEVTIESILDREDANGNALPYSSGYTLDELIVSETASRNIEASATVDDYGNTQFWITTKGSVSIENSSENKAGFEVTAKCHIGSLTDQNVKFKVIIGSNKEPWLKEAFAGKNAYQFYTSDETEGVIRLKPYQIFEDDKTSGASVLVFRDAKSSMKSACDVTVDTVRNEIVLRFKANSEVEIELSVADEVNITTQKILVQCKDKGDLGFMAKVMVFISGNPLMFAIGLGVFLLLILLLIIIILAVKKKRKMRREIEALLVSEMELEEQMLKLSSSQQAANPYYQSYGYLPPTQAQNSAPMLGQGGATPPPPPPTTTAIGLNPGSNNTPNNNGGNGNGFDGNNF